jgi:hypothetical protein
MCRQLVSACVIAALLMPVAAGAQPASRPPEGKPSKMAPVDKSLQDLLDEGWTITTMTGGLGLGFLLTQRGKWVICSVGSQDTVKLTMQTGCFALN